MGVMYSVDIAKCSVFISGADSNIQVAAEGHEDGRLSNCDFFSYMNFFCFFLFSVVGLIHIVGLSFCFFCLFHDDLSEFRGQGLDLFL